MYRDGLERAQRVLAIFAGYAGPIDGDVGAGTLAAAWRVDWRAPAGWSPAQIAVGAAQSALLGAGFDPGAIDGFWGPQSDAAFLEWQNGLGRAAIPDREQESPWGREADVAREFGPAGSAACTAGYVRFPWRVVLAWNTAQVVQGFACHAAVAKSAQRAFDNVADTHNPVEIRDLGLHLYGGCYNLRRKRGGRSLSMHSWGIALDMDPGRNRLDWGADRARLARGDASRWWSAWEAEGWTSLGRARDYDWMHVQAVAL